MTTTSPPVPAVAPTRKISRRTRRFLIGLAVFALVAIGYVAHYGQCETQSKFCTVGVVGTRSDIGFEWDSVTLYMTTYPDGVAVLATWPWSR